MIGFAVERVKQQWQAEFFTLGDDGFVGRREQVVDAFDGVGQVHGADARLARHAIHFTQRGLGVTHGDGGGGDKAIGKVCVRLDCGVVDNACELVRRVEQGPLPRHAAGQTQHMHFDVA